LNNPLKVTRQFVSAESPFEANHVFGTRPFVRGIGLPEYLTAALAGWAVSTIPLAAVMNQTEFAWYHPLAILLVAPLTAMAVYDLWWRQSHFGKRYRLVRRGQYGSLLKRLMTLKVRIWKQPGVANDERRFQSERIDATIREVWVAAHELLGLVEERPDNVSASAESLIAEFDNVEQAVKELETYVKS
jgi:hypothetical protein